MKPSPPTSAPGTPPIRQAQKMASCVEAGPGRRFVAAIASSNSAGLSQERRSTQSSRRRAMWAGGPPKPDAADPSPLAGDREERDVAPRHLAHPRAYSCETSATSFVSDAFASPNSIDVVGER